MNRTSKLILKKSSAQQGLPGKAGFTLIEVLTVVIIVGILTSVAVPQYRRAVQRSKSVQAIAMLRVISDSAERLASEYGFKTFEGFSNYHPDEAIFQHLDMIGEDTTDCTINNTTLVCTDFTYHLVPMANYVYAEKTSTPYQGVQIRLTRDNHLFCQGNAVACEVYNLDVLPSGSGSGSDSQAHFGPAGVKDDVEEISDIQ